MEKLEHLSRKLTSSIQVVSNVLVIVMLVLIFAEVISRYLFGVTFGYIEEFSKWAMIWLSYLMVGLIARGRNHITIDILPNKLGKTGKKILFIVLDIVTLGFAIILCWAGIQLIEMNARLGLTTQMEISIPIWIARICIPLGGALLALFSLELLTNDICRLVKRGGN